MAYTKRRGVQDFVTVVTMRMTKYRTLIENIIKNTKGKAGIVFEVRQGSLS